MKNLFDRNKGFTFVETLVVITLFGISFPIVMTILFAILQQQLRIFRLTEVKRQGDFILKFLQDNIRDNAYQIYDYDGSEICEASGVNPFPHQGTPYTFRDKYGSDFSLDYTSPNLTMLHGVPPFPAPTYTFPTGDLNSSKVLIDSFSVSCSRESSFSAPLIVLNYTICYNLEGSCTSIRPAEQVSLFYQTNIKLRSFPTQ